MRNVHCLQRSGGLAEYAVAPKNLTVKLPREVSAAEAAALPMAGWTAIEALRQVGVKFNDRTDPLNILVTAASGGVGHYAVQWQSLATATSLLPVAPEMLTW